MPSPLNNLQRLQTIIADSNDAVSVHDFSGVITAWNHGAERLYGYVEAEALRMNVCDLVPPDQRSEALAHVPRLKRGEAVVAFETVRLTKDRRVLHVTLTATILQDKKERPTAVGTTERDITEWKQREANLRAILEHAVEGIITIDPQGSIESFNPAAEQLFGYSRDEVIGRNISMLMPTPYREQHDSYIQNYLRTGIRKIIGIGREVVGLRKNGSRFPAHLSVSQVTDGKNFFVGMVRDLSEQQQNQERLLQAERLSGIGQAMTGLTHESRNALARSQANLRRLARRIGEQPELVEFIDNALRAQDEVGRLFEEVRQFAAPLVLDHQPARLDDLLNEAWKQLSPEATDRDARLKFHDQTIDCTCLIDRFSLRNALRNILQNALAACGDSVAIDVQFSEASLDGQPAIVLMIRDNGPGFSAEVAANLFDAFFTTKTHGTGLGLAIVKRTIEAHGGVVTAESNGEGGATFRLVLPRKPT